MQTCSWGPKSTSPLSLYFPAPAPPFLQIPESSLQSFFPQIQMTRPPAFLPQTQGSRAPQDSRIPLIVCGLWVAVDVTGQGGLTLAEVPVAIITRDGDFRGVWEKQKHKFSDRESSEGPTDRWDSCHNSEKPQRVLGTTQVKEVRSLRQRVPSQKSEVAGCRECFSGLASVLIFPGSQVLAVSWMSCEKRSLGDS